MQETSLEVSLESVPCSFQPRPTAPYRWIQGGGSSRFPPCPGASSYAQQTMDLEQEPHAAQIAKLKETLFNLQTGLLFKPRKLNESLQTLLYKICT